VSNLIILMENIHDKESNALQVNPLACMVSLLNLCQKPIPLHGKTEKIDRDGDVEFLSTRIGWICKRTLFSPLALPHQSSTRVQHSRLPRFSTR
jgi:hypothetical protein